MPRFSTLCTVLLQFTLTHACFIPSHMSKPKELEASFTSSFHLLPSFLQYHLTIRRVTLKRHSKPVLQWLSSFPSWLWMLSFLSNLHSCVACIHLRNRKSLHFTHNRTNLHNSFILNSRFSLEQSF